MWIDSESGDLRCRIARRGEYGLDLFILTDEEKTDMIILDGEKASSAGIEEWRRKGWEDEK